MYQFNFIDYTVFEMFLQGSKVTQLARKGCVNVRLWPEG